MNRRHPLFEIFTLAVVVAGVQLTAAKNVCWLTVTYGVCSANGEFVDVDTREDCYGYCISSPDRCQAVDFEIAFSHCWSHPDNLVVNADPRDIERYEYTCNHPDDCEDSFETFVDRAPADLTTGERLDGVSEEDCKAKCLENSNCGRAVSIRDSDGNDVCYLYDATWSGDAALADSPSSVMYLRKSCLLSKPNPETADDPDEGDHETEDDNDAETEQGDDGDQDSEDKSKHQHDGDDHDGDDGGPGHEDDDEYDYELTTAAPAPA